MASQFDVNIRTTGDTSGAEKVEQSLERVEQKAAAANTGAAPGASAPLDRSSYNAQLEREASIRQQILGTEAEISAKETERLALQERLTSLTTQRQILIDVETERVQALAAGDSERAGALAADLQLRQLSLQLQTSGNLAEEEALTIARQRLAAEAEIAAAQEAQAGASLLAGVNIGKARNEAITLGRELASGAGSGRTLSALLGSFGPQIAIASIAVFALVKNFGKVQEVIQAISDGIQGISGKDMAAAITKADEFGIAMRKAGEESSTQLSAGIQRLQDELLILTDKYREAVLANDDKLAASLQEQIGAKKSLLDFDRFSLDIAKATEGIEALKARDIKAATDARREELALQKEGFDLDRQFKQARDAGLSDSERLTAYSSRIDEIKGKLQGLGIAADSPNAAFNKSIGLADEQRNEILKLAIEWQSLGGKVGEVSERIGEVKEKTDALGQGVIANFLDPRGDAEKTAENLKKVKDQAGQLSRTLKDAKDPTSVFEKFLLDTIANGKSSIAVIQQMQAALKQLFATQAAAPKAAIPPPGNPNQNPNQSPGDYLKPGENLLPVNPGPSPTAKLDNEQTGAGGNLDQSLNALQQELDQRNQQLEQVTPVIQNQIPEAIGKSTDTITTGFSDLQSALADGTGKVQSSVQDAAGKIGPLFEPVATSIGTDIPAAISAGTTGVVAAVNAATGAIAADFARQIGNISLRLGAVERGG